MLEVKYHCSQAASKDDEDDPETWKSTESDSERATETARAGWTRISSNVGATKRIRSTTVGGDELANLSTNVASTTAFPDPLNTPTVMTTTSERLFASSLHQTLNQHTTPQMSLTPTTPIRSWRTRRPKFRPRTRRPARKRTRVPSIDYAPVVHRRIDTVVISAGDVLLQHVAHDTFIDYQVSSLSTIVCQKSEPQMLYT